jgi:hypothetical protein
VAGYAHQRPFLPDLRVLRWLGVQPLPFFICARSPLPDRPAPTRSDPLTRPTACPPAKPTDPDPNRKVTGLERSAGMGWLSLEVAGGWHSHESSLLAPLYICLCDDPTDLPNEPCRPDPLTRPTDPTQKARSAERACGGGVVGFGFSGGRSYVNLSILDTSDTLYTSPTLWG